MNDTTTMTIARFERTRGVVYATVVANADDILPVKVNKGDLIHALRFMGYTHLEATRYADGSWMFHEATNEEATT